MRLRFVGTCSKCRRRRKVVTDVDFGPFVKSAFCHGCKTIFYGFPLRPPQRRETWSPQEHELTPQIPLFASRT